MTEDELNAVEEAMEETPQPDEASAQEEHQAAPEPTLAELQEALSTREQELVSLKEQLTLAVERYRAAVLAASPEIPEELVSGGTIEEVDRQIEAAKRLVARIKQQLQANIEELRVPVGAPPRTPPDLSALSPAEKIAYALASRQS